MIYKLGMVLVIIALLTGYITLSDDSIDFFEDKKEQVKDSINDSTGF